VQQRVQRGHVHGAGMAADAHKHARTGTLTGSGKRRNPNLDNTRS
jgi:hypothetical protein